jgi:hypothetical protein
MAQSNQSKKLKTDLSQLVVGENWMEQTGPFLYLKMTNQESLGPFHAHELKDFIGHTTLPDDTLIRDAKNTGPWTSMYQHPYFQRRKPAVLPETEIQATTQYYYLKNGKPCGPIAANDITNMVQDKSLISTDMISTDEGKTWMKLHQVTDFDRRTYSASELPMSPEQSKSTGSHKNPFKKLMQQTDAIINLAFVESVKVVTTAATHTIDSSSEQKERKARPIFLIAIILACSYLAYLAFAPKQTLRSVANEESVEEKVTPTKKTKRAHTRVQKQAKAQKRVKDRAQQAKLPTRKPKSFTSTPVFQERKQLEDNALIEEDRYYDDGMDAIELDPIRKAVSKETYAPEEAQDSYIEDDVYLDDQEQNTGDSEIISVEDVWGDATDPSDKGPDPFENEEYYE